METRRSTQEQQEGGRQAHINDGAELFNSNTNSNVADTDGVEVKIVIQINFVRYKPEEKEEKNSNGYNKFDTLF